ncbi:MarR family winged helix-turn-helix transcriptional regulator [Nocardioides mangrovi]|uniref:MarR family transcriptional regulator n=1 Tax=Nocardioides mangrovi TaxID=2874580 RepID=A0ABS7UHG8_9ACTN|nr:MarR family transcriptional regulator [Nocardioides mangrovi]MBZ5740484.1 MarR family transcriptional regulator [Nocardioides mangrovi]
MHEKASTDDVVTGLLTASRVLVGVAARSLAEIEGRVTVTQFRTLVVLSAHGPLRQGGLAELLGVNASTTQRMVDRLEAAGLVDRQPNPRSRREVVVTLTAAGAEVVDLVTRRRRREIQTIVRRMPPETRSAAVDALRAFTDAAGEPDAVAGSLWGWSLVGD